jgi:hypothetical protein
MFRIKFGAGRQFSASKSASSPSAKPLSANLKKNYHEKNNFDTSYDYHSIKYLWAEN